MKRTELLKIAKPILFNTEMVKAILEGRKTVTRRVLKQPFTVHPNGYVTKPRGNENLCPYEPPYKPGSYMYVRETWSEWTDGYVYKAWIEPFPQPGKASVMKWHPSLHMPKEAARIFLKVTDVRVEQLQDITEEQAKAEGICEEWAMSWWKPTYADPDSGGYPKYRDTFAFDLWDTTVKKSDLALYGWDANPYVWVIEFERIEPDCEV